MKNYSLGRIIISYILLLSLPFAAIFGLAGIFASFEQVMIDNYNYADLHTFDITGHSVEKISDNLCEITLTLKNDSAYTANLSDYTFRVKTGDRNVSDTCFETFSTNLGHRQELILPAGRTVDAHFLVPVNNAICSVVFTYNGMSYDYKDLFADDYEEKYYLVEVDLT